MRDLREAAALSPKLANALKAYSKAETCKEQLALQVDLITKWSTTDPQKVDISSYILSGDLIKAANEGIGLRRSEVVTLSA